ncbi:MAG: Zn-ribbon domain-containing OB-fold protein [SAR86 cluster bacterium]|jgi:uncharacterized protein|nr:Zn-ribbon domain-containing OB-fold protein [SAR86 cluster bacterium]|tara:strand:+ start:18924 stop:19427 length:504 start_codon:yes stop_codon:yes gene_type:complete
MSEDNKIIGFEAPIHFNYSYTAGAATTLFLQKMLEGKIVGQRCPICKGVYVPPRGSCPRDGVATEEEVEVAHTGTVESFTINYIPIPGGAVDPPFVSANIVLDGADLSFMHLISGIPHDQVTIGMRVKALWRPKNEWKPSLENIIYFEPTGEPDRDIDNLWDKFKNA